jgi:hypothetical protein
MYVDLQQFAAVLLPAASAVFHTDGSFLGDAMENSGKQNPKTGFKSPPSRDAHPRPRAEVLTTSLETSPEHNLS